MASLAHGADGFTRVLGSPGYGVESNGAIDAATPGHSPLARSRTSRICWTWKCRCPPPFGLPLRLFTPRNRTNAGWTASALASSAESRTTNLIPASSHGNNAPTPAWLM